MEAFIGDWGLVKARDLRIRGWGIRRFWTEPNLRGGYFRLTTSGFKIKSKTPNPYWDYLVFQNLDPDWHKHGQKHTLCHALNASLTC